MLNKRWRQKIIDTEYISDRAISTMIVVNHQRIKLIAAAAAKKILEVNNEVSKEDVEIRRLVDERRNTSKGEKQRLKDLSKQIRKCFRDKKCTKRQEKIERILEVFKVIKNIPSIKYAKRRIIITKIKMNKTKSSRQEKETPTSLESCTASCMTTINMMKQRWNLTKMRPKTT